MDPQVISVVRRFFAAPAPVKLRAELVRRLVTTLGLDATAAEGLIDELAAMQIIGRTQVHFFDPEAEDVVLRDGLRLAILLDRDDSESGAWRAATAQR